jgi:hypothetical protein
VAASLDRFFLIFCGSRLCDDRRRFFFPVYKRCKKSCAFQAHGACRDRSTGLILLDVDVACYILKPEFKG